MRIDDDSSGLGAPLHENQTVTEAGMTQGQRIVVEPGQAPLSSEVRLHHWLMLCSFAVGACYMHRCKVGRFVSAPVRVGKIFFLI